MPHIQVCQNFRFQHRALAEQMLSFWTQLYSSTSQRGLGINQQMTQLGAARTRKHLDLSGLLARWSPLIWICVVCLAVCFTQAVSPFLQVDHSESNTPRLGTGSDEWEYEEKSVAEQPTADKVGLLLRVVCSVSVHLLGFFAFYVLAPSVRSTVMSA